MIKKTSPFFSAKNLICAAFETEQPVQSCLLYWFIYGLIREWPNPIILKNGDGIFPLRGAEGASRGNRNSLWIMKGTIKFPHERLSRNSKEKFPHERRSREWGNFFLLWLLSLEWGNSIVPWMMNREFFPSPFFKMMGLTFLFTNWKSFEYIMLLLVFL